LATASFNLHIKVYRGEIKKQDWGYLDRLMKIEYANDVRGDVSIIDHFLVFSEMVTQRNFHPSIVSLWFDHFHRLSTYASVRIVILAHKCDR